MEPERLFLSLESWAKATGETKEALWGKVPNCSVDPFLSLSIRARVSFLDREGKLAGVGQSHGGVPWACSMCTVYVCM